MVFAQIADLRVHGMQRSLVASIHLSFACRFPPLQKFAGDVGLAHGEALDFPICVWVTWRRSIVVNAISFEQCSELRTMSVRTLTTDHVGPWSKPSSKRHVRVQTDHKLARMSNSEHCV